MHAVGSVGDGQVVGEGAAVYARECPVHSAMKGTWTGHPEERMRALFAK